LSDLSERTWTLEEVIADPEGWAAMMARRTEAVRGDRPRLSDEEINAMFLRAAGFGARYWNASWDRVAADIRPGVQEYVDNIRENMRDGRGLLVVGGVGCGKTSVLALICLEARKYGEVAYVLAPDLYAALHKGTREAEETVAYYRNVDLLLLDDVDRLYLGSEWLLSRLDTFAEHRYARKLATVATANNWAAVKGVEELGRMRDRWRQTMKFIRINGPSQREVAL